MADWLAPIDGDNPSGIDLRNEAGFHAIERLMEPGVQIERDEHNNPVGGSTSAIEWDQVLAGAEELAGQGRDLRLLVIATRAMANLDSYAGVARGLDLITESLDQFWDNLHPALREGRAPRDAALRRINALLQLQNDDDGMLGDLQDNAALSPRGIGPITGRDLARAMLDQNTILREGPSGLGDSEKAELVSRHEALVNKTKAGCRAEADQNPDAMTALADGVKSAKAALDAMEAKMSEKLGENGTGPQLGDLDRHLDRVAATLSAILDESHAGDTNTETSQDGEGSVMNVTAEGGDGALASSPSASGGGAIPNRINSRKDVERCLDLIIEFYERTEPASPLPHLAKRMRRMVPMDFMELIQEIAPGGLKDFNVAVGSKDDKK